MKKCVWLLVFVLMLAFPRGANTLSLPAEETTSDINEQSTEVPENGVETSQELPQGKESALCFKSVGILPFTNQTDVMHGAEKFTKIFYERTKRKFADTEFKLLKLSSTEYAGGPLLLKQAQRIGEKYGVDALIEGYLLGYKITGGTWPSKAISYPEVLAIAQIRVVETKEGTIVKRYTFSPKKPTIYPPSIRNEDDLFGRVIRDVIDKLHEEMKEDEIFFTKGDKK